MSRPPLVAALAALVAASCASPAHPPPVGVANDLGAVDAARDAVADDAPRPVDVVAADVTVTDAVVDASAVDAPSADVPPDAVPDALADAVVVDAPTLDVAADAGAVDAGVLDASPADLGVVDVVAADLGSPDAGFDAGFDAPSTDVPADPDATGDPWVSLGDGGCNARARRVPTLPGLHVDPDAGTPEWLTNPPSSGPHFPFWAHWGAWPDVPRGNWVHNLEHGGVVMLYRCTSGPCVDARNALVMAMNAVPPDPAGAPWDAGMAQVRVVITNDALITTPVAAAAWGAVYEAQCVDVPSLVAFYEIYAGHAPEDFCADGYVP